MSKGKVTGSIGRFTDEIGKRTAGGDNRELALGPVVADITQK